MHPFRLNWDPPRRHLRAVAWLVAVLLAVLAVFYESTAAGWTLRLSAAALFAIGTVLPRTLRWPYILLLITLYPLLWILKRVLPAPANPATTQARLRRPRPRRPIASA